MIRYYLFCVRWLWKNQNWQSTRQKYKTMEQAWKMYKKERAKQ